MATGIPILTYHSIDGSGSVVSVAPSLFKRQMVHLAQHGFQSLTLSEAIRYLTSGAPVPEKRVVITFDDGYQNVYEKAFPVLADHGFRATVFLITEYCGTHQPCPGGIMPGTMPFMSWAQVREMHRCGIEFGAHTLTHPDLTQLPAQEAEREIAASQAEIQDRLGTPVETFAYPFGSYNAQVQTMTRRRFRCTVSTRLGRARPGDNPHALPRMDVYYLKAPWLFARLSGAGVDAYLHTRQLIRDARARFYT